MLCFVDLAPERPGIQNRDHDGQARKGKASQPVEHETQATQLPFKDRLAANEHPQCRQKHEGAEPAAAGGSIENHAGRIA
jgi:hypothetical protein